MVVAEDSSRRDGPFLEVIGHYHPRRQPAEVVFDVERAELWLERGARMSDTVRSLYRRARTGRVAAAEAAAAAVPVEDAAVPTDEAAGNAAAVAGEDASAVEAPSERADEESAQQEASEG